MSVKRQILTYLAEHGEANSIEIRDALGCPHGTASAMLWALRRDGYAKEVRRDHNGSTTVVVWAVGEKPITDLRVKTQVELRAEMKERGRKETVVRQERVQSRGVELSRERLEADVQDYLDRGGRILELPGPIEGPLRTPAYAVRSAYFNPGDSYH